MSITIDALVMILWEEGSTQSRAEAYNYFNGKETSNILGHFELAEGTENDMYELAEKLTNNNMNPQQSYFVVLKSVEVQ